MKQTTLPRTLALILLIVSLAMLIPIGTAVAGLLRGENVPSAAWVTPIVILATGLALMYLLARKVIGAQLYTAALALWLLAAGYFFFLSR